MAMPKLVGEGFKMFTIRVEYEWKLPRCLSYKVFGHVLNECPKIIISDVVKNLNNPRQATKVFLVERQLIEKKLLLMDEDRKPLPNVVSMVSVDSDSEVEEVFDEHVTYMASKVLRRGSDSGYEEYMLARRWGLIRLNKFINLSLKRHVPSQVEKNQVRLSRKEASNSNPIDALNSLENDDDMGTNEGEFKGAAKEAKYGVVSSTHRLSPLMLVDDDGKPLNKVDYAMVNSDSDSDVEVAYDENAQFMASGGTNDASLYDDEDYDIYVTYDIKGLMKQESAFCDMMDIDLHGCSRR
nr:zinc knuckle CX2CX4HX4C [Tanacetum cinerariifolium]